jgi:hypothetical protein
MSAPQKLTLTTKSNTPQGGSGCVIWESLISSYRGHKCLQLRALLFRRLSDAERRRSKRSTSAITAYDTLSAAMQKINGTV